MILAVYHKYKTKIYLQFEIVTDIP